ncbi:hypothetical protein DPMN_129981 [Dreissena polymorpha]|uniref:Uncharacterized protein n=1 Tax=Dreissena polymorpha TaxID=45954 RepID=A0A9D4HA37_DREPO|nr:hypothetical protein DPMN_129981 [Dreissena polymorpha]
MGPYAAVIMFLTAQLTSAALDKDNHGLLVSSPHAVAKNRMTQGNPYAVTQ